ncbi:DUF4097 family beta strand repeat-containing protein, partial [Bacillus sp. XF8]|uniref:DUF4097 family beta strand repeat-containing protein n=1 Tax=Bacillus sp. XF8 TaxID=2819289 RepID=UPI001FB60651
SFKIPHISFSCSHFFYRLSQFRNLCNRTVVGKELQTHNLRVNGSSGNVKLDFLHFHSEVYVTTTSGNVDVSLNGDEPDAELLLKSNSGRRSVAFVLDNHQQGKKETKGTSGSGDHKVQLETSSGSISLK